MWKTLASVVACCALAATPLALASDGGNSTPATQPTTSCTPIKQVYSERRWREAKPARGQDVCPAQDRAGARNTVQHFYLYRHYRAITPYRCLRGREGTFAIPCYIIACESGFDWWAMNPSGAAYIYQLLGWGAPPPNSFRNRLRNHEIAADLYDGGAGRSNWVC